MSKPTVNYTKLHYCKVGECAIVEPVDHTSSLVINGKEATTSTVQSYDEATGVFETKNSIYQPLQTNDAPVKAKKDTPASKKAVIEPEQPQEASENG